MFVALGGIQTIPQGSTGTVHGTIRRVDTGEPVEGVQISMTPVGNPSSDSAEILSTLPPGVQLTFSIRDAMYPTPLQPTPLLDRIRDLPTVGDNVLTLLNLLQTKWQAISDASGNFIVSNVPSGNYVISARKDGFTEPAEGFMPGAVSISTTPFPVVEGKLTDDLLLSMAPAGTISGRVRDSLGMPMPGVTVAAYQYRYAAGGRAILTSINSNVTDDRGQFRLFWIPAGNYLIAATPKLPGSAQSPQDSMARTFFPGSLEANSAGRVVLKYGQDITDLNIDLRNVSKVKVSGRVVRTFRAANPPAITQFHLLPSDPEQPVDSVLPVFPNVAPNSSTGQFELLHIPAGSYELLTDPIGAAGTPTERTFVDVGNSDVEGITITIPPAEPVKAHITFVGGDPPANAATLRPQIRPKEIYNATFSANGTSISVRNSNNPITVNDSAPVTQITSGYSEGSPTTDASGVTTFPSVSEGRYTFVINGLPPTAYISDVREGGMSIFDSGLHVGSQPPGEIEIVANMTDTKVEGTVLNAAQKPVGFAKVVLVPQQSRRGNTALYRTASTNTSGQFSMHGVPPGPYKVFAWQYSPPSYAWQNASFITNYEQLGQAVIVTATGVTGLQVDVIP